MLKRIAITGPESTGKSLLAEGLAEHFHTVFVPEYARDYLDRLGKPYEREDVVNIAKGQIRQENRYARRAKGYLFCDTDLIVAKIWMEHKYGSCDPWILRMISRHRYDLYLLCDIDLPWEFDPLREHPHLRRHFFDLYYNELKDRKLPFEVVSGIDEKRLGNAVRCITGRL